VSKTVFTRLTVGKTYEVLQGADGRWAAIDDDGDVEYWILEERFSPVPDPVPEPVNEWMQVSHVVSDVIGLEFDQSTFINVATGRIISFDNVTKTATIDSVSIEKQYAEAFAQMVGYKWDG
jgi:hypothetical protein